MTEDELLRLACVYAEQDRESLMSAYEHMKSDPEYKAAKEFAKRVRAYRLKRWGKSKSEATFDGAKGVSIFELLKRAEPER